MDDPPLPIPIPERGVGAGTALDDSGSRVLLDVPASIGVAALSAEEPLPTPIPEGGEAAGTGDGGSS